MSILSSFKSLFKKKTEKGTRELSPDIGAGIKKSISRPKQGYGAKGKTSGGGTVVKNQPAGMKDYEMAGLGTGTVIRESSAQPTPDGRYALSASEDNTIRLWEFDWEWEF